MKVFLELETEDGTLELVNIDAVKRVTPVHEQSKVWLSFLNGSSKKYNISYDNFHLKLRTAFK